MKLTWGRVIIGMAIVATFGVGAMVGRFATRSVEAAAEAEPQAAPFASEAQLVAAHREPAPPPGKIEPQAAPAIAWTLPPPGKPPGKPEAADEPEEGEGSFYDG